MRDFPLVLPEWPAPGNVRAAATTRRGGVSKGVFDSLNLGAHTGDEPGDVAANRRLLKARLGLVHEPAWLRQVHGSEVVSAEHAENEPVADASWTELPGIACAVLVADCLPVLFCDRAGTKVAAAHGGWRGLAGGILEETVRAMNVRPAELLAWLGPAIGPGAFEVGPEVRRTFIERQPATATAFQQGGGDRWFCDIFEIARIQLHALGVGGIFGGGLCTWSDPERFYSYRRDSETGRMAALIWMESAKG